MRTLRSRLTLRLFGLATFAFTVLSALGAGDPWSV
jgi:hypothetical protein